MCKYNLVNVRKYNFRYVPSGIATAQHSWMQFKNKLLNPKMPLSQYVAQLIA